MNIELRELRYFVAVAEELHFTRAANRLNIAQPALSHQIRQLERRLGVQLFRRTSRSVALTAAGSVLLEGARRTLAEAARAADAAVRADRGELETLRVGFTDSAALSVLPNTVRRFRAAATGVHLDLTEDSSRAQIDAVERGTVDIALVRGPVSNSTLRTVVLLREPYAVALPVRHALTRRTRVPLRAFETESVIHFPRHSAPEYYDAIVALCTQAGIQLDVRYEGAQYQTILSLVAAGLGISLVSASVRNLQRTGVEYRPLSGTRSTTQIVAVCRLENCPPSVETFLRCARETGSRSN